jgi:hypothetical protein
LNGGSLGDKTTSTAVPAKVSLESLVAGESERGNRVTDGNGCQDPKVEESFGRCASTKTSREKIVRIGSWFDRDPGGLSLHQGVGDKDKASELGQAKQEVHKPHPQHIRADQEVGGRESKRKRGLSMRQSRRRRQGCLSVEHPAMDPGLEEKEPVEKKKQSRGKHVNGVVGEEEEGQE